MPSEEQATELIENCEMHDFYDWNGQSYKLAIGPNGRCIILKSDSYWTSNCYYDNSSQDMSRPYICLWYGWRGFETCSVGATYFGDNSVAEEYTNYGLGEDDCHYGHLVRAVRK